MLVKRIVMVVIGLLVVAGVIWSFLPEPVDVDAGEVTRGPLQVTVDEEGRTRIRERYVISAPLAGRVRRIVLDPGDAVEARTTVVATIEPTDPALLDARARAEAEARVRAAESAIKRAEARKEQASVDLDLAEEDLGRVQQAFDRGAATEHELEQSRLIYRSAGQAHRAISFAEEIARFELDLARSALLHVLPETDDGADADDGVQMHIRAPIDGLVLRVLQESVAVVRPGAPLLEVGDPADLEVVIDVLSTDAVMIRPGHSVIIERWGGDVPLHAKVRLVEPSAFTKISALGVEEQRVNVVAAFESPFETRATLGDGFRVEGRIVIWEGDDVLRVPTSALFRLGDAWAVFTIEGGRAVRRSVEIGHRTGREAEVAAGLDPGTVVIVHPSDQVSEGVRVDVRVRE